MISWRDWIVLISNHCGSYPVLVLLVIMCIVGSVTGLVVGSRWYPD